jgi:hypothetical protein
VVVASRLRKEPTNFEGGSGALDMVFKMYYAHIFIVRFAMSFMTCLAICFALS